MSADFDALVELAARAIDEGVMEYVTHESEIVPTNEASARWALEAVGLPALLERVEAAEGALADVWDAGATAAGGYGHEDGWTHDMSPYLDNPYRAALNGADHGA